MKHTMLGILAIALLSLGACKGPDATKDGGATSKPAKKMMDGTASAPINLLCPIMGEAVESDGVTSNVNGHAVGFCCSGCQEKFDAWSADKKLAFVQQSMTKK